MMVKRKYILLVDDDIDLTQLLKLRLEAGGYEVGVVNDGKQVLPKVKERRPDLIILDVFLPKVDGFTLVKEIQALFGSGKKEAKAIPIIVITGRASMLADLFRETGVADFIPKPFSAESLMHKMDEILGKR